MTLINACIIFNSVECFNLIIEHVSLEHYVTDSPMSCALSQYSKGNKYFVTCLINRINLELERIESANFVEFENCIKEGREFVYHPNPPRLFNFSCKPNVSYDPSIMEIPESIDGTYVVQSNLKRNISHERYTPYTKRQYDYFFKFIK